MSSVVTEIRWAQLAEGHTLEDLQRRSSMVWEDNRADLLAHPDAIEVPVESLRARRVRVALDRDRIVGFATVLPSADGVGELEDLFVEPDVMRRGVGRVLVDDAVVIARSQGLSRLAVVANPNALEFYDKVGFVSDGEVPTRFGPGLRMHLDLGD